MFLARGYATFNSWNSYSILHSILITLESVRQQALYTTSIGGRQLELFVHRTDGVRRLVAAQVASSGFAAHNFSRSSDFHNFGHGSVRFQFLLPFFSFFSPPRSFSLQN